MKLVNRILFQLFLGFLISFQVVVLFLVKGYPLAKTIRRSNQVISIFSICFIINHNYYFLFLHRISGTSI